MKKVKREVVKEVFPISKPDRRMLPNVPDDEKIRIKLDRRGPDEKDDMLNERKKYIKNFYDVGKRYVTDYNVEIKQDKTTEKIYKEKCSAKSLDTSASGMLVEILDPNRELSLGEVCWLKFQISPGSMPEGFESKVKIKAKVVRAEDAVDDRGQLVAFQYEETLLEYFQKRRWKYSISFASLLIFITVAFIMLMRAENIIYFRYNKLLYLYSIIAAVFLLSRYLFGALYRDIPINPNFTPSVSIIIPCFNEEEWISRTIMSCMNQDYPIDKIEVIVVDDCSNDHSLEKIRETIDKVASEGQRFKTGERLKLVVQEENKGKREALAAGAEIAEHELVVFVDSDSFLEPTAIKNLVQPFQDPKMGGVTGRTDIENKYTNMLTKMQAVRYYVAFRIMKAAESYFDAVTCLSGPISCYRKDLVLKYKEEWLNQKFLGHPATFGDDRSMTNFILRTHRTSYQDNAICYTIVPSDQKVFLKQQMRWKRSWLRESFIASRFIWRKEPFMSLFFYMGLIVPIAAPIVVVYNLIIIPITQSIFPTTFLTGLLLMALLMSFVDLFFRRSSIWIFGFIFCLYYEFILLWQMPIAWATFWKSTWGTRMTPQDINAINRKKNRWSKEIKKVE
ncbi:glycosyltransferase [uncultured Clostridium sp.]|uniref:glycosyltransferase family 2 protein n=1 Tax=uncultured Clostridium sp. TaxID=59620 RepID=UPI0028E651B3|nr:glycosyltransferase [uncultured Clostridium sp.]